MRAEAPLAALTRHLAQCPDELTLTFEELDALVDGLPERAWWSIGPWSNDETWNASASAWLDAGFRVAAVEPQGFVTFVRVRDRLDRLEILTADGDDETVTGTLRLVGGVVQADAGGERLLSDAFYAALPDGSWPRRVRSSDGPAFLVACWFSLREPGVRGRLVGVDGRELTPEAGRALVDSLAGTGTEPRGSRGLPGTDASWSGVSLRAPDRSWDLDAAPMRDVFVGAVAQKNAREAAGLPAPPPPPRPAPPTEGTWRNGREVLRPHGEGILEWVVRGARVFDEWRGLGTVLSVVPQHHKTEVLVRFDDGCEAWVPVFRLLVEEALDTAAREK